MFSEGNPTQDPRNENLLNYYKIFCTLMSRISGKPSPPVQTARREMKASVYEKGTEVNRGLCAVCGPLSLDFSEVD